MEERSEINAEQLASQQTVPASHQGYMTEEIWDQRSGAISLDTLASNGSLRERANRMLLKNERKVYIWQAMAQKDT